MRVTELTLGQFVYAAQIKAADLPSTGTSESAKNEQSHQSPLRAPVEPSNQRAI